MSKKVYNGWAGLCKGCAGGTYTLAAKICSECKKQETNSCFKRCASCATKSGKCSYCGKKLKTR